MLKLNKDQKLYSITPSDYDKSIQLYEQTLKSLTELGQLFKISKSPVKGVEISKPVQELFRTRPSILPKPSETRRETIPLPKPTSTRISSKPSKTVSKTTIQYTGKSVDLDGTVFRMRR